MTNQVTARVQAAAGHGFQTQAGSAPGGGGSAFAPSSSLQPPSAAAPEGGVQAALGAAWAHCVNTRLVLERLGAGRRVLRVAKSPACGAVALAFAITPGGLEEEVGAPVPAAVEGSVLDVTIANAQPAAPATDGHDGDGGGDYGGGGVFGGGGWP